MIKDVERNKPLFSKETNEKFYDESGKVVGTSTWHKLSVGLFVFALLCVIISISSLLAGDPLDPHQAESFLYLDTEWHVVGLIPGYVTYIGWLFFLPLIFALIGFFSKKYNTTHPSLTIISGSITALLLWALCVLLHFGLM